LPFKNFGITFLESGKKNLKKRLTG